MPSSFTVLTTLLALKALFYLPVAGFAFVGWESCGRNAWAGPDMVSVQGVLEEARYEARSVGKRDMLDAKVGYSYRHGGRAYRGDAMVFCPGWSSGSMIDGLTAMFEKLPRVGSPITVWVDPARPENAVLFKYMPRAAMLILGFVGVLLAACAIALDRRCSPRARQLLETT